tara:strand:- start:126 stop:1289 length:1164 start_codon:yes stop_codon:yes gene_type:complete
MNIETSAPGKCILFGEHAVVFGQPAVAVAIEQRIHVSISPIEGEYWKLEGGRFDSKKHPHLNMLRKQLWPKAKGAPALSIEIKGDIPRASGLGSSAALSVAAAAALRAARGRWCTQSEQGDIIWTEGYSSLIPDTDAYAPEESGQRAHLFDSSSLHLTGVEAVNADECALIGHAVEAAAQGGRASPMDASTCAHGGVVLLSDTIEEGSKYLYQRQLRMDDETRTWELHNVGTPEGAAEVYLVIGNTGVYAPTSEQVAKVAKAIQKEPERMREIETIGIIARRGIEALNKGDFDAVGRAMTENQVMLRGLGVSCPELDTLVRAAAPSSLGAKLTGAGGGGCMVALTRQPEITLEAIKAAGGTALISSFGNVGMRLEKGIEGTFWNPLT